MAELRAAPNSKAIAALLGPTLAVSGISIMINRNFWSTVFAAPGPALALTIYLSGVLVFVAGLAIVRFHRRSAKRWPILISIFGWMFIVGGLVRMLLPGQLAEFSRPLFQGGPFFWIASRLIVLLGLFLTAEGFIPERPSGPPGAIRKVA